MSEITVAEAQNIVPILTFHQIADTFHLNIFNPELYVLYIANMLMRGKLEDAKEYINTLPIDFVRTIVNTTSYHTYYGTLLHVLLYWNNTPEAYNFYKLLTNLGAKPILDYYEQLPWEQTGILYSLPSLTLGNRTSEGVALTQLPKYVVDNNPTDNRRIQSEFSWIYNEVKVLETAF